MNEMKKQIHFDVSQDLHEEFHRLVPGRKKDFFIEVMEIAIRIWKARKSPAEEVMEEWDG